MKPIFNQKKAAQVSAFFANQEGGRINVLKLVKLLYLSDRYFMEKYRAPILYDNFYSLDNGPVVSYTLNLINGEIQQSADWDEWMSDRDRHEVAINRPVNQRLDREDLDELSDAEFAALEEVWRKFGSKNQWDLVEWTHTHCSEWKSPHGSSLPLDYEDVFVALGFDRAASGEIQEQLDRDNSAARVFSNK